MFSQAANRCGGGEYQGCTAASRNSQQDVHFGGLNPGDIPIADYDASTEKEVDRRRVEGSYVYPFG
jgi:hypothetical protein